MFVCVIIALRSRALHCSSLLLQFCLNGDYKVLCEWLSALLDEPRLHDEALCQAVRMTRGHATEGGDANDNDDDGDVTRLPNAPEWNAWLALLLAVSSVLPTAALQPYVFGHLYESAKRAKTIAERRRLKVAQRIVRVLQRRLRKPDKAQSLAAARRQRPPSLTEFAAGIALSDCSVPISIGGDAVGGGALQKLFGGSLGEYFYCFFFFLKLLTLKTVFFFFF